MDSLIVSCKQGAITGMEHFLSTLSFVPDDKLTWTPAPTAKSAIRIAAHTALYAARFARMIREGKLPGSDGLAERWAKQAAAEVAITSRAEMESIFRKGTDEVLVALDSVPPEMIGASLDSGFGWSMPMSLLMNMPSLHAMSHAAQIDYLQTCWGDQEVHF